MKVKDMIAELEKLNPEAFLDVKYDGYYEENQCEVHPPEQMDMGIFEYYCIAAVVAHP